MRKPTIWVWDARSLEVVERSLVFTGCNLGPSRVVSAQVLKGPLVFTGCNQRWVSQLAFTPSGDTLCSVGADDDHLLVLWDWQTGVARCHVLTHKERIFGARCAPAPSAAGPSSATRRAQPRCAEISRDFGQAHDAPRAAAAPKSPEIGRDQARAYA